MLHRSIALAVVSCITLGLGATAPAYAADEGAEEKVRYEDLNLNDESDAARMLRRIRTAARDICDDRSGPLALAERAFLRKCVRDATGQTVAELGMPTVGELFEMRGR